MLDTEESLIFLMSENLTLQFFLLTFSFVSELLTVVHKSTPSVHTLSARVTISSLLK